MALDTLTFAFYDGKRREVWGGWHHSAIESVVVFSAVLEHKCRLH